MENLKSILRTLGGLAIVIVFCLAILLAGCAEVEKPAEAFNVEYIEDEADSIKDAKKSESEILEQVSAGDYNVVLIGEGVYKDEDGSVYADSLKVGIAAGDDGETLHTQPVSDAIRRNSDDCFFISSAIAKPNLIVYEMEHNGSPCYVIRIDNYYTEDRALSQLFALKDGKVFSLKGDFTITNAGICEVAQFETLSADKTGCILYAPDYDHVRYSFDFANMTDEYEVYIYTAFYAPLKSGMPNPLAYYDGDYNVGFYETLSEKLSLDYSIATIVGSDPLESWREEVVEADYTAVTLQPNMYSCMKHFGFTTDEMRKFLTEYHLGDGEYDLTQEEIELLVSDDAVGIAEYFASDMPIRKGENLYSLSWIYSHPIEDYIAEGITPEEIAEKMPLFDNYPLTDEAKAALNEKVTEYMGYR